MAIQFRSVTVDLPATEPVLADAGDQRSGKKTTSPIDMTPTTSME